MRKYLRRIAKHQMEKQGVRHINKKIEFKDGKRSYFSDNWRNYIGNYNR